MTNQEALNLLDNAVAQLQVNRVTHAKLQEAIRVLQEVITSKVAKEEKKK